MQKRRFHKSIFASFGQADFFNRIGQKQSFSHPMSLVAIVDACRELEIARLILRDYSSKARAQRLGVSPEMIKAHRYHLVAKLNISSQPELFFLFVQQIGLEEELT